MKPERGGALSYELFKNQKPNEEGATPSNLGD
jgi:hypothetical protein